MSVSKPSFQYAKPEINAESLADLLDHVLDVGVVVKGELTISVADVDLIYLGIKLLICSPDKLIEMHQPKTESAQPESAQS